MSDPSNDKLREAGWRRPLTATEQAELNAWLAAHPEARADWQAEQRLTQALASLPDVPVSTNFTARVLQAVDASTRPRRRSTLDWALRVLLPRAIAGAAVVLGTGLVTYHEALAAKRMKLAQSVSTISEVTSLPGPDVLEDFDTIRQLNSAPRADEELLALMK